MLGPGARADYDALAADLAATGRTPQRVVHLWSVAPQGDEGLDGLDNSQRLGFYSLLFLAQAFGQEELVEPLHIGVVTDGLQPVDGAPVVRPERATLLGPCKVIPKEFLGITCQSIDVQALATPAVDGHLAGTQETTPAASEVGRRRLAEQITTEMLAAPDEPVVAYRGETRWVERFERVEVAGPGRAAPGMGDRDVREAGRSISRPASERGPAGRLRERGVYLITGGLGGIGLVQAEYLARTVRARLVLVGRHALPPREEWDAWLRAHTGRDAVSRRIRRVQALEDLGAEVMIAQADVADMEGMRRVIAEARERFGAIHGVLHAAGVLEDGVILLKTPAGAARVLAPKVRGALVLDTLLRDVPLDFLVLFSSISALLGPAGQVDYAGANAFLNAFAHSRQGSGDRRVVAVDWGVWQGVGLAAGPAARVIHHEPAPLVGEPAGHPLLGVRAVDTANEVVYRSHYGTDTLWLLDEHRIKDGAAIVPGTGYLEIARAAVNGGDGRRPVVLTDVFFLSPLAVPDEVARDVRITLERDGASYDFVVASAGTPGPGGEPSWEEHARGTTAVLERAYGPAPAPLDLTAIRQRCTLRQTVYDSGAQHTKQEDYVRFGPRWKNLKTIDFGPNEALATLELPDGFLADLEQYAMHPALLDLATGFPLPLVPGYDAAADFYVPFSCKRLLVYEPLPQTIFSHARYNDRLRDSGMAVFDLTITDAAGQVLVEVEEFTVKRVDAGAMTVAGQPGAAGGASRSRAAGRDLLDLALEHGIAPQEGAEVLARIISGSTLPQVVASSIDLQALLEQVRRPLPAGPHPALVAGGAQGPGASSHAPGSPADAQGTYIAPRNDVERTLAQFWQDLMGLERVGVHDDFFELGGYSLIAVRLFAKIKKAFGIDLSLATLFQAPTVAACAAVIADELGMAPETSPALPAGPSASAPVERVTAGAMEAPAAENLAGIERAGDLPGGAPRGAAGGAPGVRRRVGWSPLVEIQSGESQSGESQSGTARPVFFCIHGAGGNVLNFRDLALRLGQDQPFFALQAQGVDGKLPPLTRVEDMASLYLAAIRTVQPQGPYYLGGYSGGGVIAFEIAHQLRQQGQETALLAFIDTFCPVLPIRRGLRANWHNLRHLGLTDARVLPKKGYDTLVRHVRRAQVKRLQGTGEALPHQLRDLHLWDTHLRALSAYRPQVYPGAATLFRAAVSDPANDYGVADMGWSEYLGAGLEIKIVPGTHDSLVQEPNVSRLGSELRACIDRAAASPIDERNDSARGVKGRNGTNNLARGASPEVMGVAA